MLSLFAQAPQTGGYTADIIVFVAFLVLVMITAFSVSRKSGENSESYFLAGRGLAWWLIGFSLIAANISAEQFIGMSGNASSYIGLAVASYEWIAALSLVIVAFLFLPKFLRAGIYTIPEYLERRYNKSARTIMSLMMVIMLVIVNFTAVTYAGAKYFAVLFAEHPVTVGGVNILSLTSFCWFIGILAAAYVFAGGLKACAWSDLLQGSSLIAGGAIVLYFALKTLGAADPATLTPAAGVASDTLNNIANAGAWERFNLLNATKLRMNLPSTDTFLPITALLFAIWIPNLYYWGLNQYIIQRTLGSKSLGEGQKGLVFAAAMKLVIPFIIVFPGMMAYNLYKSDLTGSAKELASGELQRLEAFHAADGSNADGKLFAFNEEFAADPANYETARAMLRANASIAVVDLPEELTDEALFEFHEQLKKTIAEKAKNDPATAALKYGTVVTSCDYDSAYPTLVKRLVPKGGFTGFLFAALLGAIISSVAAILNAASTIFTMDIYQEYCFTPSRETTDEAHARDSRKLVFIGRLAVIIFVLIGCYIAPKLADPRFGGIFKFIQEFQGYISPGILAVFVFSLLFKKAPAICGALGLILNPIIYGALHVYVPQLDFLNRMAVTFLSILVILTAIRVVKPRKEAYVANTEMTTETGKSFDLTGSKIALVIGILVVLATLALYAYYWDSSTPMFGK